MSTITPPIFPRNKTSSGEGASIINNLLKSDENRRNVSKLLTFKDQRVETVKRRRTFLVLDEEERKKERKEKDVFHPEETRQ